VDKAFVDRFRHENLAVKRHVELVVPARKNMQKQLPITILKACGRWRKLVETVGSHLTERYHIWGKQRLFAAWASRQIIPEILPAFHFGKAALNVPICFLNPAFLNLAVHCAGESRPSRGRAVSITRYHSSSKWRLSTTSRPALTPWPEHWRTVR
jgi:hypothetical protein